MQKNHLLAGFDLGSGILKFILAQPEGDGIRILYHRSCSCEGIRRNGVISDIEKLSSTLQEVIVRAEDENKCFFSELRVALSGTYFRFDRIEDQVELREPHLGVSGLDIETLESRLRTAHPEDFEHVHLLVDAYRVNHDGWIENPQGLFGEELGARAFNITASSNNLKSIRRSFKRAGHEPAGIAFSPVVAAGAVLNREEEEAGVVYVDMGHSSTTLISFQPNPKAIEQTQLAGYLFTHYLAVRLKVSFREAERLKDAYASCLPGAGGGEKVRVYNPLGEEIGEAAKDEICRTVCAEVKTRLIPQQVMKYLERNRFSPGAGFVLGGGGARMEGLAELFRKETGYPARVGRPLSVSGNSGAIDDPSFHGVIGLLTRRACAAGRGSAGAFMSRVPILRRCSEKRFFRSLERNLGQVVEKIRQSI